MTDNEILRAIIAHADDIGLVKRAAHELSRSNHTPDTLCRIYRLALSLPSAYPDEVRAAMEAYDVRMQSAHPNNKTVTVRFRCTENEKIALELFASREGKTLSEFIRSRCFEG